MLQLFKFLNDSDERALFTDILRSVPVLQNPCILENLKPIINNKIITSFKIS